MSTGTSTGTGGPSVHPLRFQARPAGTGKIQARETRGRYNSLRWLLVFLTQLLFYGLCWLDWNGRQAVLFHLDQRKFYLFDLVLWPQDVVYLALLLIIAAAGLFFVTAMAGRLFCGFACPQTVYTSIFMWIEARCEGDRLARLKLDAAPLGANKLLRRGGKHLAWLAIAGWTGVTFVGYFTPIRDLVPILASHASGPWESFWVLFYGGFTYLQAGFMREQVCQHMCPYSRFQGVMFDPQTLIIGYDRQRGEPRGARRAGVDKSEAQGDCVDCTLCVQVCPAGIDIRDGLQYECISCGLCIDACNNVMDKLGSPRGLIRFDNDARLQQGGSGKFRFWRPRLAVYGALLAGMTIAVGIGLAQRIPLQVDILRERNALARELEDGLVENIYTLKLSNMTETPRRFALSVAGAPELPNARIVGTTTVEAPAGQVSALVLTVQGHPDADAPRSVPLLIHARAVDDEAVQVTEKTAFLRP